MFYEVNEKHQENVNNLVALYHKCFFSWEESQGSTPENNDVVFLLNLSYEDQSSKQQFEPFH